MPVPKQCWQAEGSWDETGISIADASSSAASSRTGKSERIFALSDDIERDFTPNYCLRETALVVRPLAPRASLNTEYSLLMFPECIRSERIIAFKDEIARALRELV